MSTSRVSNLLLGFSGVVLGVYLLGTACSSGGGGSNAVRPTVNESVPANESTDQFLNTLVTATFDQDMDPATIDDTTFTLVETLSATPVAGTVTYHAPTRSATFNPTADLAASTEFTATITTGAENTSGLGVSPDFSWIFTTGTDTDGTAPTVTATVPVDAATDVLVNSTITATFSEQINLATLSGTTFTVVGGSVVAGTITWDSATLTATFTPSVNLQDNTTYTCTITTGVEDQAENALAAPFVWTFTTEDATSSTSGTCRQPTA
jgi:hypothetical protein